MKRIVILGTGKIAYALYRVFQNTHHEVVCLGRNDFDAAIPATIDASIDKYAPDIVINAVAFGGVPACVANPHIAYAVNTFFPQHLAQQSGKRNFLLIHFSSESVYPQVAIPANIAEDYCPHGGNIYALSKFLADTLIPQFTDKYIIFRLPIVFGPSKKRNQFLEKLLPLGLAKGELSISTDVFSNAIYSFDSASAIKNYIELGLSSGVYHLAGATTCSLYDIMYSAISNLKLDIIVHKAKLSDFTTNSIIFLNAPICSAKISPLRAWNEALVEYCDNYAPFLLGKETV